MSIKLTPEQFKALNQAYGKLSDDTKGNRALLFQAGFIAALAHVQPTFDAIEKLLTYWRESLNPLVTQSWQIATRVCIEDLEAILAGLQNRTDEVTK